MAQLSVEGREIHYVDIGSGAPVVLLHAFPLDSRMWAPQIACLSATFRVVAPDLVGFGRSSLPGDPTVVRMSDLSGDVAAVIESLAIAPAVVVGLSMGGYVAFDLMRSHPGMVAGLVLADTRAAADTSEVAERRTAQQREIAEGRTGEVIETLLGGLLGETTRAGRPALVSQVRDIMASAPPAAYIAALEAMKRRPDSTPGLGGIGVPTLVLVGEEDTLSPTDSIRTWQSKIPDSELMVLPRSGHLSNMEAADDFNAALTNFLSP